MTTKGSKKASRKSSKRRRSRKGSKKPEQEGGAKRRRSRKGSINEKSFIEGDGSNSIIEYIDNLIDAGAKKIKITIHSGKHIIINSI